MRTVIFLILNLLFLDIYSQNIKFEESSFDSIMTKAKSEKKIVFIDVSTEWCGSCKWMEENIFTLKEVSNFYNNNFINIQVDAEKGEGMAIAKRYNVLSYPSYLFINDEGILLSKNTIGGQSSDQFINSGKKALATLKQRTPLTILDEKYAKGLRKKKFLFNYLSRQIDERDECDTLVLKSYLSQLNDKELNEIKNVLLIANTPYAFSYKSPYFMAVLRNLQNVQLNLNTSRFYMLMHVYGMSMANKGFFPIRNSKNIDSFKIFLKDYDLIYPYTIKNDPQETPYRFQRYFYLATNDTANYKTSVNHFLNEYVYSDLVNEIPLKINENELFKIDNNSFKRKLSYELNSIGIEYSKMFSNTKDLIEGMKIIDHAEKLQYGPKIEYAKSLILAKLGNKSEAMILALKAKDMALEEKSGKFMTDLIDDLIKKLEEK